MNVSLGARWQDFVDQQVEGGRYGSASEVVREGLRLVEEREARLTALREAMEAAISRGGRNTSDDLLGMVEAEAVAAGAEGPAERR